MNARIGCKGFFLVNQMNASRFVASVVGGVFFAGGVIFFYKSQNLGLAVRNSITGDNKHGSLGSSRSSGFECDNMSPAQILESQFNNGEGGALWSMMEKIGADIEKVEERIKGWQELTDAEKEYADLVSKLELMKECRSRLKK